MFALLSGFTGALMLRIIISGIVLAHAICAENHTSANTVFSLLEANQLAFVDDFWCEGPEAHTILGHSLMSGVDHLFIEKKIEIGEQ